MWITCPRTNTPRGKCRNPFCLPDFVSGSHARGTREIIMYVNSPRSLLLHIPPMDPPRRIYRLADSPQRDFGRPRWIVLSSSRGSDDNCSPSTLTYHLSLSLPPVNGLLSPCCHTLRRCSLAIRTLCSRREEWDHDPPAVTARNPIGVDGRTNMFTR